MGSEGWIIGGIAVVGLGALAYYLYTNGYFTFASYDPKNTDLFPFASDLENARKTAKDELARLKDTISMVPGKG